MSVTTGGSTSALDASGSRRGDLVDPEVFARRLAKLEDLLSLLRGLAQVERERFLIDRALQAQAERWLHLAAECALDLAPHLIAARSLALDGPRRAH
jgi:uncharacterized protein YutE (UPF0331/DUF86 family)